MTDTTQPLAKFKLFGEWRNREIYGYGLADAITRAQKLQRPDKFAPADSRHVEGAWCEVKSILAICEPSNSTRGNDHYIRAIVEFADGRIEDVEVVEAALGVNPNLRGDRSA